VQKEYSNKTLVGNWWEDRLIPPDSMTTKFVHKAKINDTAPRVLPKDPVVEPIISTAAAVYVHHKRPSADHEAPRKVSHQRLQEMLINEEGITSTFKEAIRRHSLPGQQQSDGPSVFFSAAHSTYGGKYSTKQKHRVEAEKFNQSPETNRPAGLSNAQRELRQKLNQLGGRLEAINAESPEQQNHLIMGSPMLNKLSQNSGGLSHTRLHAKKEAVSDDSQSPEVATSSVGVYEFSPKYLKNHGAIKPGLSVWQDHPSFR
jgi:hypothetical protein